MTWSALNEPMPRAMPKPYRPIDWCVAGVCDLPQPFDTPANLTALESRSTRRGFGPVSRNKLGSLLWHTMRCKGARRTDLGFPIEHRPTPSAGGIHPIHVLVLEPQATHLALYVPSRHELNVLADGDGVAELRAHCAELVSPADATILFFVAEFGRTQAKYHFASSLVWRDAGVVQGILAVAAEGLELNYCLLGTNGNPWLRSLAQKGELYGVGAALLGTRP